MSLAEELRLRRPFSSVEEEGLISIFATWNLLYRSLHRCLQEDGLTLAQYNVLRILRGAGPDGLPLMAVAARMVVRYPNVTRLTDRLEADGLIRRRRSTKDRRVVHAVVSQAGLDLLARLDGKIEETTAQLMRGADRDSIRTLISTLASIRAPLRQAEVLEAVLKPSSNGEGAPSENGTGEPEPGE